MSSPRVFGLPHLSEDAVAAFADGVLSAAAADRARRHCAECTECAEAVRAQRETALLLRTASNPCMPADLLSRLATVPMSAPLPPPCGGLPTVRGVDGRPMFVAHDPRNAARLASADPNRPGPRNQPGPSHGHRRVLLPVGILASAAAVVAAGAIGSQLTSVPRPAEQQPASVYQVSSTSTGSVQRSSSPTRTRSSRSLGQTAASPTGSGQLSPALVSARPSLIRPLGAAPTATAARSGS